MIDIPCLDEKQRESLVNAAEQTALRFCCPVYLVGSAIHSLYPNDIDIYIAVSSETYLRLFTNYNRLTESEEDHAKNIKEMKIQQAKIYKKQKEYFQNAVKGWDFDVKFQAFSQFIQDTKTKTRLDLDYKDLW